MLDMRRVHYRETPEQKISSCGMWRISNSAIYSYSMPEVTCLRCVRIHLNRAWDSLGRDVQYRMRHDLSRWA